MTTERRKNTVALGCLASVPGRDLRSEWRGWGAVGGGVAEPLEVSA